MKTNTLKENVRGAMAGKGILILILLSLFTFTGKSQVRSIIKPNAGIVLLSSGNAHGGFISPYLGFTAGTNNFLVGAMVHKRSGAMTGFRLTYSKNLSGDKDFSESEYTNCYPDLFQLNFYSYAQYTKDVPLCASVVNHEARFKRETMTDWSKVRLNTGEAGAGIEFRVNFTNSISWRSFVGAAVYYHFTYLVMNHDRIAPSLNLGTGIHFTIN